MGCWLFALMVLDGILVVCTDGLCWTGLVHFDLQCFHVSMLWFTL